MFIHNIDPILFSLGPLKIHYYGLNYALTFIITYFLLKYLVMKFKKVKMTKEEVLDLVIYIFLGVVLGARIFYGLAYNFNYYLSDPLKIFYIWEGGMSYHGGLIGGFIGVFLFTKKKKIPLLALSDMISIPISFGLFTGRITNFINGELFGRLTDLPWAVNFGAEKLIDGSLAYRHPSQLYEALKNLLIFFILLYLYRKHFKTGFITSLYFVLFGSLRFLIEFFRMPDSQIGFIFTHFTLGQLLCVPMVILGIAGMVYFRKKKKIS